MKHRRNWAVTALLLLVPSILGGATTSSAQSGNVWVRLGNLPAGAWSLAGDRASGTSLYTLGNEGISRTTDGGASWAVCNRDARTMTSVTPLPGQKGATLLYAVTSAGLRFSEDGCHTWKDVPTQNIAPSGTHIRWLAPYPNNHLILYAGMDGLGGLYRSADGGNRWQPASQGIPAGAWITSLVADPQRPEMVFVGLRYAGRNHPSSYLYRSDNGGLTWRSSSNGIYIMPNNGGYVNGLAWSGESLFASSSSDGLYQSTDRGTSWRPATLPGRSGGSALPLEIDSFFASLGGELLVSTSEGAFHSLDGGRSWQSFGPDGTLGKQAMLALEPKSGRVLLGTSQGVWSYVIQSGAVSLPTATPAPVITPTPTPPPPANVPTSTPAPPTATPTKTPAPPSPTPTLVQGYKPSDPAQPGDPQTFTFFTQTSHNLGHGFRDFWQANGGVGQFGYPITEEFIENGVSVQYFERARLEYRDGQVTLGRLGAELTAGQFFRPLPFFVSNDSNVYFGTTGHAIEGPFLDFWRNNGRETLLGLPISESFKVDGSEYQWFERSRFEWHPYLPEGQHIVLGNIGAEAVRKKGWLP